MTADWNMLPLALAALDEGRGAAAESQALMVAVEALAGVTALRLFIVQGSQVVVRAATDSKPGTTRDLSADFTQALETLTPQQVGDRLIVPFSGVVLEAVLTAPIDDDAYRWLQLLMQQIDPRPVDDISVREAELITQLHAGQSYAEMAQLIARYLLPEDGQRLVIGQMAADDQLFVLAEATHEQARMDEPPLPLDLPIADLIRDVGHTDKVLILEDLSQLADLQNGGALQAWLQEQNAQAMGVFACSAERAPLAIFFIFSEEPRAFPNAVVRAYRGVVDHFFALMETNDLHRSAQTAKTQAASLIMAGHLLASAESFEDMGNAVVQTVARRVDAVSITLFDPPISLENGAPDELGKRTVAAFVTPRGGKSVDNLEYVALPGSNHIDTLRENQPVIVRDVQADSSYAMAWQRDRATELGLHWMAGFGMRTSNQLLGTLDLLFEQPQNLEDEQINIYSTLADQIGMAVYTRRLLQDTEAAHMFASRIVQTNQTIAEAETYEDMAQAVINDSPDTVLSVSIALFNRPFTMMGYPSRLDAVAVVNRRRPLRLGLQDRFDAMEDARVTYFLHQFLEGRMMQLWNAKRPRRPVMAEAIVTELQKPRVNYIQAFGLTVNKGLRGILVFASREDLRTENAEYDRLRAIADQLAAAIENRILLRQTTEALDLIRGLYDTTSKVFRSANAAEILAALHQFATMPFDRGHIALVRHKRELQVVAELGDEAAILADYPVHLSAYPAHRTLAVLEALEIRDAEKDAFISDEEREALLENGIAAMVILPLLSNRRLSGLVVLTNSEPTRIPPERLRAMRTLSDQISVVFENRQLLRDTRGNLQEIQTLYEASRLMVRAQDTLDVLRVLRTQVAGNADLLMYYTFDYAADGPIDEVTLAYELDDTGERVLNSPIALTSDEREDLQFALQRVDGSIQFVEDTGDLSTPNPLLALLNQAGYTSVILSFVRTQRVLTGLIALCYRSPQTFDDRIQRLYDSVSDQVSIVLESQGLLRESQLSASQLSTQVQALQTINDIAIQTRNLQDETQLLQRSARAMVDAIGADHAGIMLYDELRRFGTVRGEYPGSGAIGATLPLENDLLFNEFRRTQNPLVIEDVDTDPNINEESRVLFQANNIKSVILVPLEVGGDMIGSFGVDFYTAGRKFDPNDVRTAQTIAAQLAVGLQNVRLLTDAQRRAEQLQRINEFSQSAQSNLDMGAIVAGALAVLPQIVRADHISVLTQDDQQTLLQVAAIWNEGTGLAATNPDMPEMIEGTTMGHVYTSQQALYIEDCQADNALPYPFESKVSSLLAAPLRARGRTLGVVNVGARIANAYSNTDVAVFQQMANQMAVAMETADAYTRSQRLARNKTLASEISVQLQRQNDIEKMVDLTINELGRVLGARRARIRFSTRPQDNE